MSQESQLELPEEFRNWGKVSIEAMPILLDHIALIIYSQQQLLTTLAGAVRQLQDIVLPQSDPGPRADDPIMDSAVQEELFPDFDHLASFRGETLN